MTAVVAHQPVVSVRVAGREVPAAALSAPTDTPLDLHLPPQTGGIAGASGTVDLAPAYDVASKTVAPWSPALRARPGDPITADVDGHRVLTGVVGPLDMSLRDGDLSLPAGDALAEVEAKFSAPATLSELAPRPGFSQKVPTGANMLFYVVAALEAMGAHATVQVAGRTGLHVPMCGTAHPYRGELNHVSVRLPDDTGMVPWTEPDWVPMSGGRIGALNGWFDYTYEPQSAATVGSWHLSIEIDPSTITGTSYVRVRAMGDESGFGLWFTPGDVLRVATWDAAGTRYYATYEDQGQTLTEVPISPDTERVLLVYNVVDKTLTTRIMRAGGVISPGGGFVFTPATGGVPTLGLTDKVVRVRSTGQAVMGAVSLMDRATAIGALDNDLFTVPRTAKFNLNLAKIDRWRIDGHPPVEGEEAVQFVVAETAKRRMVLSSDDFGSVWINDPSDWPFLSVSHHITDGVVAGDIDLHDLGVQLKRRRRFSRVRVNGRSVVADTGWGPGVKPNRIYAGAGKEITLTADSDPVELWFEPGENMFWAEAPDLALRYAGEAATEPWHLPDDFARGRGTWGGGYIRNKVSTEFGHRWATPADVIYTLQQVTPSRVKITVAPGPGLGPDEEYINLPHPSSTSLPEQNPARFTQHLPVLRGPATATYGEITATSTDIPYNVADWGEYDEYVHEADLTVQNTGHAGILAQIMADSHEDHFGSVEVRCGFDPTVKTNQRVLVSPRSRTDVTLDGVVTGIPTRDPREPMVLKLWVHRVEVHSISYDERLALTSAANDQDGQGRSYAADRARHPGATYDQEQAVQVERAADGTHPGPASVITNGTFEAGDYGWALTSGATVVTEPAARSGTRVARLDATAAAQAARASIWVPVTPGSRYLVTTHVRGTAMSYTVDARPEFRTRNGAGTATAWDRTTTTTFSSTAWQTRTAVYQVPAGAVEAQFGLWVNAGALVHVDDVTAQRIG